MSLIRMFLLLTCAVGGWSADSGPGLGLGPVPVTSAAPSGAAGGGLGGTYPNPNLAVAFDNQFQIEDQSDPTKLWNFDLSGMTTAKALTLKSNQTTTQTLLFPNITATDTAATLGLANAFTSVNTFPGLTSGTPLTVPFYLGGTGTSSKPGATFVGSVIWGNQDGTTAALAGQAGELLSAGNASYANLTTTATFQALNSISITPGYWLASATVTFFANGATTTTNNNCICAVGTSATTTAGALEGASIGYASQNGFLGSADKATVTLSFPLTVTSTTTYYLIAQATFSAGNVQTVSHFHVLRIR